MSTRPYLPRPEYPRPDRQRAFVHNVDWLNLNGSWEFRFDPKNVGREERWFLSAAEAWPDQIVVPFCWESLAAWGEADSAGNEHFYSSRVFRDPVADTSSNYRSVARHEVGWYRRKIILPDNEHWRGRRIILTIGAADFRTEAWCNGAYLGEYEDGYTPFEFDLTEHLEALPTGGFGALLAFRVEDPMDNREQPVGKQWGWYTTVSGIWQTVFIEPRSATYIDRYEVRTDLTKKEVAVKVVVVGKARNVEALITNPLGEQTVAHGVVQDGVSQIVMKIDPIFLWDTNHPHLYQLCLTLTGNDLPDVVHGYFGMRSLSSEPVPEANAPGALVLNGERIYLRGALYQSYHPEGVYTAGDLQTLRDDISAAKRFGFDFLRVHIKIDDPLLLHCADTMGILLMADFPNFGEGGDTPLSRARYEKMMRKAIQRDFNHPSIIAWCLFNETWGFGGQAEFVNIINPGVPGPEVPREAGTKTSNEKAWIWINEIWELAKSLDETRLIEDMSVVAWDHLQFYGHGKTDVNSWHFYTNNYEHSRKHIEEVVRETFAGSSFNYVPGHQQDGQPLINSEYGGVGALDGDRDVSWSFKFLTNELRRHGPLSAYIYTELHDVEWERNGFLNYDRTQKEFGYDPRLINNGDVLPIDAPPIARHAPGGIVELDIYSSHYSQTKWNNVSLHWRLSGIDSLGRVYDEIVGDRSPISFPRYQVDLAQHLQVSLPDRSMACSLWVAAMSSKGEVLARNYIQLLVDAGFAAQEDFAGKRILRRQPHSWKDAAWSLGQGEREDCRQRGSSFGRGAGYFEWEFALDGWTGRRLSSIRVLCEASSRRENVQQTDANLWPSEFQMMLNGVLIYRGLLPNHPHDARGALSYLRGGDGAYGYLAHATVEGDLLSSILQHSPTHLVLRCLIPQESAYTGGLTVYGSDCGRFPICPTLILEC